MSAHYLLALPTINPALAALRLAATFSSVPNLLADLQLSYVGATPAVVGDLVVADNFIYKIAASFAVDQHVTTAGGVKLYVLPSHAGHNVLAFGARGNGAGNDLAPFQKALDTGLDLLVPTDGGQVYPIDGTLNVTTGRQGIYGTLREARSMEGPPDKGHIKFNGAHTNPGFLVTAAGVAFLGLAFDGISRTVNGKDAILFQRTSNTDDMDGIVKGCFFRQFANATTHYGRGLQFERNAVVSCGDGANVWWPLSGVVADNPSQGLPQGHRALRVIDNRFHSTAGYAVHSNNELLRGALITGNTMDLGEGLLRVDGDIVNSIIASNIVEDATQTILRFLGDVIGVTITGNTLAGTNGAGDANPFAAIHIEGSKSVEDLIVTSNRIADIKADAILIQVPINGGVISDNSFRRIGGGSASPEIRGAIRVGHVNGLSVIGNTGSLISAPYFLRPLATGGIYTWTRFRANENTVVTPTGFREAGHVDGGLNAFQA